MQEISAIALFCDDIREEIGGQYSLIGVANDNLAVPGVPGAIPKFAIYVRIHLSVDAKPREFRIVVKDPSGEVLAINSINSNLVSGSLEEARDQGNPIVGLYSHLIASPFPINSFGRYAVELQWEDEVLFIGSFRVIQLPDAQED